MENKKPAYGTLDKSLQGKIFVTIEVPHAHIQDVSEFKTFVVNALPMALAEGVRKAQLEWGLE